MNLIDRGRDPRSRRVAHAAAEMGFLPGRPARPVAILISMAHFSYGGQRLAYTVHGEGPKVTVLTPGLLLSQKMQTPLARNLARRGNRVITLDPLGHGASDRPRQMWRYSISEFAKQVVALLDHLELDQAIVGVPALGANLSTAVAATGPAPLAGL